MKRVIGLIVFLGLIVSAAAVDFNEYTAKYKLVNNGCERITVYEVARIQDEVVNLHSRLFLKSLNFYDDFKQPNVLFWFSNGFTQSGIPKFLATFTTLNGCQVFQKNPREFMPYLNQKN